jgi:RNA 2',3'-cyclic 3'-phosphodiesterase
MVSTAGDGYLPLSPMRLFLAIHLSDAAIDHLRKVQAVLRPIAPDANFTRDVNLHLTLRFLGETAEDRLGRLRDAVRAVCEGGALTLRATALVFFPPAGGTRIVGARMGGESADQLMLVQSALERAVRTLGYEPEQRRYTPHVTLARAARAPFPPPAVSKMSAAAAKLWPGPEFAARKIALMESELSSTGSKYRAVSDFDLFGENSV